MRVPFRVVDVFAERPLEGNQLCVVPEDVGLSGEWMQRIAQEIAFSETVFVTSSGGDRYSARIFTPGEELPFAGHPTLGSAFVMVSEGRVTSPATLTAPAGDFTIEVDAAGHRGRMHQLAATFGEPLSENLCNDLAGALGLSIDDLHLSALPQVVSTGLRNLMVPLADDETVRRCEPAATALQRVLRAADCSGCYVFAVHGDSATARLFAPEVGVAEDPATGSAAGPLGAFALEHRLTDSPTINVSQGAQIGRPSVLVVECEREGDAWRPWVGGGVFVVGSGEFDLPDQG